MVDETVNYEDMMTVNLDGLLQESIKNLEAEFYSKKFYFSYSSFSKLLWNPAAFYQMYVLGNREEKIESHLVQGKIIHALLLEEDKFKEQFIISPSNLPTGNLRTVIDKVYAHYAELKANGDTREKLDEFQDAILDVMKDMNYHQSLKTDQQRLDKVLGGEAYNYWAFLQMKGNKTLIDQESYNFCKNVVDLIKTNKEITDLLGMGTTEFENKEVYNELPVSAELSDMPFGIKGIVDNVVIDHDKKIISINDIKTSSKDLKDFKESIEYYNYWLQAVMYTSMVSIHFKDLIEAGYKTQFHFVVIDRTYQTYAFPVSLNTLGAWFDKMLVVFEQAKWHYINKSYELPYEFATGKVVL